MPGVDVSGTVAALAPDVTGLRTDTAVAGFLPLHTDGTAAEFMLAPQRYWCPCRMASTR